MHILHSGVPHANTLLPSDVEIEGVLILTVLICVHFADAGSPCRPETEGHDVLEERFGGFSTILSP